ncbi:MAG: LacI family DNA-binding transcriptional regulator [Oscillospiraceae bacterium]|nr:LacI family DNA-binding transcriptional regulator [Oscillospiraceae bacterium]
MACTLKDVAKRANVSIVTVHKCIYGKPGISEETRKRVLAIVEEMHYTVNPSASSLKRDNINLVIVCPGSADTTNSFHEKLAEGARQAARDLANVGAHVRVVYAGGDWKSEREVLRQLAGEKHLHGVALYSMDNELLNEELELFQERRVPLVTFNADAPGSPRVACVSAPALQMGELAAELLVKMKPDHDRIVIVGGDKRLQILRENTTGFYSYIQRYAPEISLLEINNSSRSNLREELEKVLASLDDVTGIYCSMTRNALMVCQTLHKMGLARKVRCICTDVFEELRAYLQDGTIDAVIWQNPFAQCYNAAMLLHHYVTTGKLEEKYFRIPISPVMMSNFDSFL